MSRLRVKKASKEGDWFGLLGAFLVAPFVLCIPVLLCGSVFHELGKALLWCSRGMNWASFWTMQILTSWWILLVWAVEFGLVTLWLHLSPPKQALAFAPPTPRVYSEDPNSEDYVDPEFRS